MDEFVIYFSTVNFCHEYGYNVSTYSVKISLCLFNWIGIYQTFTATLRAHLKCVLCVWCVKAHG